VVILTTLFSCCNVQILVNCLRFGEFFVTFFPGRRLASELPTRNMNDSLQQYVRTGSSEAFGQIVRMHADAVYSQSLRQLRDPALAEEVTQRVFILLAKKAGRISQNTVLAGWLFNTTRHCGADLRRAQIRRRKHEQQAMIFRAQTQAAPSDNPHADAEPLLNNALTKLGRRDRDAILLRYFHGQSLREVGTTMGISEDAAKQRVSRAVEKLRAWFAGEGLVVPSGMIAAWLGEAVKPAPAHVALNIRIAPLSKPMSMWGLLGSKVAAGVMLGTMTIAAAAVGVKAIADGGALPAVTADQAAPATGATQATPIDTLRKLSAALHRDDRSAIDSCLTDDGTDPDMAALVRSHFHFTGAWAHLLAEERNVFKRDDTLLKKFGGVTLFPALDGGFEAMVDKMLEKGDGIGDVKIDGPSAAVRVNVPREFFDGTGQNRMRFLERWSGAMLTFRKVNGDWKLDTSRSINIVMQADLGNKNADPVKVIRQMNEMAADAMAEATGQIETGQLATPAAAGEAIDRMLSDVVRACQVNTITEPPLPVVGG
jgi:RNA polymerase sigma factor (sigma-70 family)